MNKNKTIQSISISIIIIAVLISGYILMSSSKKMANSSQNASDLAPMVDGKQLIKMTVFSVEYDPNNFRVKVGIPVQWEITSSGQPGCASGAVVSSILPNGLVYLNPNQGQVTVAEFTPQKSGTYRFSCTMNMARGTIEVVS